MKKKFLPFLFVVSGAFFAVSAVYAGETFIIGNVNYARSNSSDGNVGLLLFFFSFLWLIFKIYLSHLKFSSTMTPNQRGFRDYSGVPGWKKSKAMGIIIKSTLEESRKEKAKDELVQRLKGLPLFLQIKLIGELPIEVRQEILERVQKEEAKELAKKRSEEKPKEQSSEQTDSPSRISLEKE